MAPYASNGQPLKATAPYMPLEDTVGMQTYRYIHAHTHIHHMTNLGDFCIYECPQNDQSHDLHCLGPHMYWPGTSHFHTSHYTHINTCTPSDNKDPCSVHITLQTCACACQHHYVHWVISLPLDVQGCTNRVISSYTHFLFIRGESIRVDVDTHTHTHTVNPDFRYFLWYLCCEPQ